MGSREQIVRNVKAIVVCPDCGREMRLFGIEPESHMRDLFTFERERCEVLEVRGVRVTPESAAK